MKNFYQVEPKISNTFKSDPLLEKYLNKILPPEMKSETLQHLEHLGDLASGIMLEWAQDAEAQIPLHIAFDAWGRRVDKIQTAAGWMELEKLAAREGIIATAYERKYGALSRVYQMALLYLYSPSSAIFSCPLAMTDGAARSIELFGTVELKNRALPHLLSKDPKTFWTAGQWMTERTGGSDVSETSTLALPFEGLSPFGANYTLEGTKWFTSATTSQIALTLARPQGAPSGSKGLQLFYLELRSPQGELNNIQIHRLKDKLGTKALPTAELSLQGTPALSLSDVGEGVKRISRVLNITRIYNSICALGHMRRCIDLALDYSKKRRAFGKFLIDHPLHKATLQQLEVDFETSFFLCFHVAHLLGLEEVGEISASQKILLRALTPIVKLYTGKKVIAIASEVVEIFGGAGYVEDTGIPRLLRDAQVFSIWEGTTNVLSLDMLRAFEKEHSLEAVLEYFASIPASKKNQPQFTKKLESVTLLLDQLKGQPSEVWEKSARQLAFTIAEAFAESLR